MILGCPTGLESVMVVPKGGAEEALALGSQSHPSVTAMVTKAPEPEVETIRRGLAYSFMQILNINGTNAGP